MAKKMKTATYAEKFFKYTGESHDGFKVGDILRFRQILNLDCNRFYWSIDAFRPGNYFFRHHISTEYSDRNVNPTDDLNNALSWINDLYPGLEEIQVDRNTPLTIFGKKEYFENIKSEFDTMMDEFKKRHPEAVISVNFDWNWVG